MNREVKNCFICDTQNTAVFSGDGDYFAVDCLRCGKFKISGTLADDFFSTYKNKKKYLPQILSYRIKRADNKDLLVTTNFVEDTILNWGLPNPIDQIKNLILFLGKNTSFFGEYYTFKSYEQLAGIIGAVDNGNAKSVYGEVVRLGKATIPGSAGQLMLKLTYDGWHEYDELLRSEVESKKAFMAMQFGGNVEKVIFPLFKKTIAKTGFDLITVNEKPTAGLIEAKIELEIRTSKFLIADLSDHNNGAYWEAGFAKGLGKEVIYTCRKGVEPHFDTDHHYRIIWNEENLAKACDELLIAIRNTFPVEAIMEDIK